MTFKNLDRYTRAGREGKEMNAKYYNFMNGLFISFTSKHTSSTLQVLTK